MARQHGLGCRRVCWLCHHAYVPTSLSPLTTSSLDPRYGVGHRMALKHTRAIIDAIHSGDLLRAEYITTPVFNLQVPTACPGVPLDVLNPQTCWDDHGAYNATLLHLGQLYASNFAKYADGGGFVSTSLAARISGAGPTLPTALVEAAVAHAKPPLPPKASAKANAVAEQAVYSVLESLHEPHVAWGVAAACGVVCVAMVLSSILRR